ncbi:Hsp90 co-chaperone Cdc37 [Metarhizium guizhouense ARSEF 977]|uniref:Hsp90 co-chaperone Cdc37 n=1 Tax=Metarhizium guizhouense (strain ARSEF 977) TaxID=1276136 RepID=A0A0B4GXG3_METGA|nr:Hsp90 co-chaperone Cdc37 [Metarhizium guizhouense ARSEF 977]
MTSPGHRAQEAFTKDVNERFQRIRQLVKENAKQRATKDEELEQVISEQFTPDMRAALETGLLDEVKVLGKMRVKDAQDVVALLSDAGCLSIEPDIIDTTAEEGQEQLKYIEQAVDSEPHIPMDPQ